MNRYVAALLGSALGFAIILPSRAADLKVRAKLPAICAKLHIDPEGSDALQNVSLPPNGTCKPRMKNGLPLPDPSCSPGAINPTLTVAVLKTKGFTTKCVRHQASSPAEKQQTYGWDKIKRPAHNSRRTQALELRHIHPPQPRGAPTRD